MKTITTADLRKDASNWNHHFIVKKMKQGRDKLVDKQFIVLEVPVCGDDDKLALDYAMAYLKEQKKAICDE